MIELVNGLYLRMVSYARCSTCRVRYNDHSARALASAHIRRTEHRMAYGDALVVSRNPDGPLASGEAPFYVKVHEILSPIRQGVLPYS